jgi:transposase
MARPPLDPLRPLSEAEREQLTRVARSQAERADRVARAKALLAVADEASFTAAARAAGRTSGDAVAHLVSRFNQHGLGALDARHGGGPPIQYGPAERERILCAARRTPDRERDGTATWSLTTLQRALRQAPDGLPQVSTFTILQVLHEAGLSWQANRSWCETGVAQRKRKAGVVRVVDPASPKNSPDRTGLHHGRSRCRAPDSGARARAVPPDHRRLRAQRGQVGRYRLWRRALRQMGWRSFALKPALHRDHVLP